MELDRIADMDWGFFTPEFADGNTNTIIHVFNHNLKGNQNIDRTLKFIIGRINWSNKYLRCKFNHKIVLDDIGQHLTDDEKKIIINSLNKYSKSIEFTSERD